MLLSASCPAQGDPARGRAIVANRPLGLCLYCHHAPIAEEPFQGDLAPDLAGVGSRLSARQLRERLEDPARLNPATIMPSYGRLPAGGRVAAAYRGRPILSRRQIEDVVSWLATLR